MPKRRIGSVDLATGELLDEGVAVWIGRKLVSPYGREWMQINQNALAEIAADRDLGVEAFRVFFYLNSRLDFENLILVPQVEIAEHLSMKQPSVSRAIKLLVDKGIIIRAPNIQHVGRLSAYRLNPHYGWKGKIKNLHQARQERIRIVQADEGTDEPEDAADASTAS